MSNDTPMIDLSDGSEADWQTSTVVNIIDRTPTIKSFVLKVSRDVKFLPGQHVDIRLSAPDGYQAIRSYSIAGSGGNRCVEVAIERLDDGEVSPFFHSTVELGDEIELRGPLGGHFVWSASDGGPLLMIGGGSGVVPLVSMVRHRLETGSGVPALLLVSAKTIEDVLYRDELLEAMDRRNGFTFVTTLTRDKQEGVADFDRRIDASMMADVISRLPATPRFVFICGNNPFVNTVADGAIAAGVPSDIIRTERYGA